MPAVWLSWSMLSFCLAILSYVWRTGASDDPSDGVYPPLTPGEALAIRTVLTVVFGVGLVFFVMILRTFASYGTREVGWRRSWLTHGQYGEAQRARERNQQRQAHEEQRGQKTVETRDSGSFSNWKFWWGIHRHEEHPHATPIPRCKDWTPTMECLDAVPADLAQKRCP